MKIKKKIFLEKKEVVYDNDFIDNVILQYDKRTIIIFFYIIYHLQQDSKIIEINKKNLKQIFKSRISDAKLSGYIRSILKTTVYYRSEQNVFENGKLFARKNDYIEETVFEKLSFSPGEDTIKFLLKEKYRKMFLDIKDNFSKNTLEELENMSKISILIFLQLNRWKNWKNKIYMNFEYFKLNTNLSEGYRQMDVIRKLKDSTEEIKKNTGLSIDYEIIRSPNGRKIEQIVFFIDNKREIFQQRLFDSSSTDFEKKVAKWVLDKTENFEK